MSWFKNSLPQFSNSIKKKTTNCCPPCSGGRHKRQRLWFNWKSNEIRSWTVAATTTLITEKRGWFMCTTRLRQWTMAATITTVYGLPPWLQAHLLLRRRNLLLPHPSDDVRWCRITTTAKLWLQSPSPHGYCEKIVSVLPKTRIAGKHKKVTWKDSWSKRLRKRNYVWKGETVYLIYQWGSAARHSEVNEWDLTGSVMIRYTIQIKISLDSLHLVLENKKSCTLKFDRIAGKTWDMRRKRFLEVHLFCDEFQPRKINGKISFI